MSRRTTNEEPTPPHWVLRALGAIVGGGIGAAIGFAFGLVVVGIVVGGGLGLGAAVLIGQHWELA